MGGNPHAEPGGAGGDCPGDGAERQQPEDVAAQAVNRCSGLPSPHAAARRPVVDVDLARHREQQSHRMIGDFVYAPLAGNVGYQNVVSGGRVDVDDVDTGAVARDHATIGQLGDHAGADRRVLGHDSGGVVGHLDHLILGFALGGDQLEARLLDDRPLDVDVAVVV